MVIAGQQEDSTMGGGACEVAVLDDVTRAVNARSLGVPHGKDAVVIGADRHVQLLRAQYGGRREIFVDARLETDVVPFEKGLGLPKLLVDQAERRSAVTGYKAAGIQPRSIIGRRTRACVPVRKTRPDSKAYLSSRVTGASAMLPSPKCRQSEFRRVPCVAANSNLIGIVAMDS